MAFQSVVRANFIMKYVVCTQQEPLALYSQSTLKDLGHCNIDHLKLLERTDVVHFLSYVAPCMGRGDAMKPHALHNLLLVSGFQCNDEKSVGSQAECQSSFTMRGNLPSKAYPTLPVEVTVTVSESTETNKSHAQCHHWCRVSSLRFQIIDAHGSI